MGVEKTWAELEQQEARVLVRSQRGDRQRAGVATGRSNPTLLQGHGKAVSPAAQGSPTAGLGTVGTGRVRASQGGEMWEAEPQI